jgi:hypothetical protein
MMDEGRGSCKRNEREICLHRMVQQHSILFIMYIYIYIFENFGNSRFDKIIHIKQNIVGYIPMTSIGMESDN